MDQICKLQPHRTMHLQGFDDYGAAAALWGASDTGFTVSGVFRDMADFAVLVLFQKDDPFGHPLFSYLPDGDLTGLVLDFDVTWQGIQSWESLKNAWTDWNTLDYSVNGVGHNDVKWIGTTGITVTCNTTGRTGASATYVLNLNSPQPGDKVTLWYQNQSFISPAISTSHTTTDQAMWWQGNAAYNHWVTIGSATYSCLEDSLNSAGVANNIAGQINASDPNCTATTGGDYGNEIFITLKAGVAGPVAVSSSDGSAADTLSQVSAATILQSIAQQINAINWVQNGPAVLTAAVVLPNQLVITAAPGADGNMVAFYQTDNNGSSRLVLHRDQLEPIRRLFGQRVVARSHRLHGARLEQRGQGLVDHRARFAQPARRTSQPSGRWSSPTGPSPAIRPASARSRWPGRDRSASRKTARGSARPDTGRPLPATIP